MEEKTYAEGLRDGQIMAIEKTQAKHEQRLNHHSERLARMERIIYLGLGGLTVLQALPLISDIFKRLS